MMILIRCVSVPFVKRLHSMRMHCYVISVKKWVFLENQIYSLNIEDIFAKFTGHPRNWINMISSKGQVYAIICWFYNQNGGSVLFWTGLYYIYLCLYISMVRMADKFEQFTYWRHRQTHEKSGQIKKWYT